VLRWSGSLKHPGLTDRSVQWDSVVKKMNLLQISSIFTAPRGNLTTDQIDLCGGMEGESTTERLDLSWPRRWIYYRTIQSLLVNDQSHKIQLEALSQLILRLVNQEMGGFGPRVSSHWSSRSWISSTERIHKPRNITAHKVKPEALSQFDIEACVSERTYYRTVQIHYFKDESTTERFNPTISGDELTTDQFNPLN
jgi:hypothetical protein